MKYLKLWIITGSLSLLSACALHQTPVTLMPVGPTPHEAIRDSNDGYLIVYSGWDPVSVGTLVSHHYAYKIASGNSLSSQDVKNFGNEYDEAPQKVILPQGSYRIFAKANGGAKVIVPVIVKAQETTYVYLDGSGPKSATKDETANVVRLPNDDVVGWAATVRATE